MTPVEAIRVGFRSARGSGIAALAKHLRLPGSSVAQMPLRNALRAPRRTLLTVLGIGAVLSVLVAFMGLIDSFVATVDRSEAEVAHGNPNRIVVSLDGFRSDRTRDAGRRDGTRRRRFRTAARPAGEALGARGRWLRGLGHAARFLEPDLGADDRLGCDARTRPSRNRDLRKGGERPRRRGRRPDHDLLPAAPGTPTTPRRGPGCG